MKTTLLASIFALAVGCGLALEASAQANPNQLVNNRKGAMNLQAKYLGPILAMVQDRSPYDPAVILRNSDYLSVLTQLAWDDFQPATVGNTNTRAKEEVYKEVSKFKGGAEAMQTEVQKLAAAARAGDRTAVGVAARNVGKACNSCHEAFATFEFRFRVQ
jgi:cytochrome c556